jgi:hypothetical protein
MVKKPEDRVVVYKARGELSAQIVKGLLEASGIPSLLQSNAAGSVHPFLADGMGEYKVTVAKELAEKAREIIEAQPDV